ncbi:unnamed protein product [Cuscuta campestris]|uniref:Uncharacterized protein n=1 Tax=Cuscuta campestris TaxID=132261 RepID=A0A484NPT4_9ASTE|nr:unnamed protein product [Cuscuta campestris]
MIPKNDRSQKKWLYDSKGDRSEREFLMIQRRTGHENDSMISKKDRSWERLNDFTKGQKETAYEFVDVLKNS